MMYRPLLFVALMLALAAPLRAETHQARIPLRNGQLQIHDLNAVLCRELRLPACPAHDEVNLNGPAGPDFLFAVNACLWHGCSFRIIDDSAALLTVDSDNTIGKMDAIRRLSRVYVAEKAPQSTAAQARNWGLAVPVAIDSAKPLVVLIHGLDSDRCDCAPLGVLLLNSGQQIAYFSYPGDQPIDDSAALLGRCLRQVRSAHPGLAIDLVAHSMGGLVARSYVEGPDYAGGVDRMILVAPPNHGSSWARFRSLLSIQENLYLRRVDPNWHWTWFVTEGLGEAGDELLPGSEFLKRLDAAPRRAGVRYTIIAGNHSSVSRAEGNCVAQIADWFPARTRTWWGFRHCYNRLERAAGRYYTETCDTDGPVTLASTQLAGVSDYVVLPADHVSLYMPMDGNPPVAWPVIRARLVASR
ncbi:MAG TPA: alpha/beta hydrolase [Tepidisphaeraceae bacterium]|jgi:pimeloyl-ACP methyl ester carboxylesterase